MGEYNYVRWGNGLQSSYETTWTSTIIKDWSKDVKELAKVCDRLSYWSKRLAEWNSESDLSYEKCVEQFNVYAEHLGYAKLVNGNTYEL